MSSRFVTDGRIDHNDRLLTAQEVAEWLKVRPAWVQEMARNGQIPAIKLGKYWRFSRVSVAVWIEANEMPALGGRN